MKSLLILSALMLTITSDLYSQEPTFLEDPLIGRHTVSEWHHIMDTTWGPGSATESKLEIFDFFHAKVDSFFSGFINHHVNWDSAYNHYRPIIESGISRGRFTGIMNKMSLLLGETHTHITDIGVSLTALQPGIPLMLVSSDWRKTGYSTPHFGAAVTTLDDTTVCVVRAAENHPLGLEPGDIIIGYDSKPWHLLYRQLLDADFPMTSFYNDEYFNMSIVLYGANPSSFHHIMMKSVGLNWHLFNTIDIIKYNSPDTLHLPVDVLDGFTFEKYIQNECIYNEDIFKYINSDFQYTALEYEGLTGSKSIGYIRIKGWYCSGVDNWFKTVIEKAIDTCDGVIMDFRETGGGNLRSYRAGLSRLFNDEVSCYSYSMRENPGNTSLIETVDDPFNLNEILTIPYHEHSYFPKPVAVLIGPNNVSSAEDMALILKEYEKSRFFGKPTLGAAMVMSDNPSPGYVYNINYDNWRMSVTPTSLYNRETGENYIHIGCLPDQEMWLTRESIYEGKDILIDSAASWITRNTLNTRHLAVCNSGISISPNPVSVSSKVSVKLDNFNSSKSIRLELLDLSGRVKELVYEGCLPEETKVIQWDASLQDAGLYILRCTNGNDISSGKIVICR